MGHGDVSNHSSRHRGAPFPHPREPNLQPTPRLCCYHADCLIILSSSRKHIQQSNVFKNIYNRSVHSLSHTTFLTDYFQMGRISGYLLWLMPSQSSQENITLQQHINSLSSSSSTISDLSSTCNSHANCTSHPQSRRTNTVLSAALQDWSSSRGSDKLTLELQPPQTGDIYFQAIINPIKPSSSVNSGLLDLRKRCEIAYDVHPLSISHIFH